MPNINIEIVSKEGSLFAGDCKLAVIPAVSGEIGVMFGHELFLCSLSNGKIKLFDESNNQIHQIDISGGFASMQEKDKLLVLAD